MASTMFYGLQRKSSERLFRRYPAGVGIAYADSYDLHAARSAAGTLFDNVMLFDNYETAQRFLATDPPLYALGGGIVALDDVSIVRVELNVTLAVNPANISVEQQVVAAGIEDLCGTMDAD